MNDEHLLKWQKECKRFNKLQNNIMKNEPLNFGQHIAEFYKTLVIKFDDKEREYPSFNKGLEDCHKFNKRILADKILNKMLDNKED